MDINIDDIINDIIEGLTYRKIAEKYNVKLSTLHDYICKPEHSARARVALEISADTYADKAESVLIDARPDSFEMQRAKELSQFYRWKSKTRNPKRYSDKVDITTGGEQLYPKQIELTQEQINEAIDKL